MSEQNQKSEQKSNKIWLILLPVIITGLFGLVNTLIVKPRERDAIKQEISLIDAKIRELENHLKEPPIAFKTLTSGGGAATTSLAQLYENCNPKLRDLFFSKIDTNDTSKLLYLYAAAGSGKSTFFEERFGKPFELSDKKTLIYRIDTNKLMRLEDLKKWFSNHGQEADLVKLETGLAVNYLPGNEDSAKIIFETLRDTILKNRNNTLFVFDGIDEIGNTVATKFLEYLDNFLEIEFPNGTFIIVSGRPEGFKDYLRYRDKIIRINFMSSLFNMPIFDNMDLVKIRYQNYCDWRGENSPPLSDLQKTLLKHPFLIHDFSVLMLSGPIIKYSDTWYKEDESLIKEMLLGGIFSRNQKTHQRPPANNDEYIAALEDVVLYYLKPAKYKAFYINPNETVKYGNEDKVNIQTLLNRSGLIYFDPADTDKIYFKPTWVPIHLLKMKRDRLSKKIL